MTTFCLVTMRFLRTDKDDECAARFNTRASLKTQRAGTWKEKKNMKKKTT